MRIFGKEETKGDSQGTASSEVNVLQSKTEEEQKEAIEVNKVDRDHETLISPQKSGRYNFIVNCKCHWQGRAVNITEANKLAADHREARKKILE